ncbi:uncharacterized protein LOC110730430 [Chenopodium quinoa]|uniref:uncharacterized protein LOC110730430 n=1 Tax=Chenopodium quinoa TaxID=63459 RepID=UPI000B772231|nr:uncharacterized protein LOC110730430 [Chenopodium quinoa]
MINDDWINVFPGSYVYYSSELWFDHCPSIIHFKEEVRTGPRPFKFFDIWGSHLEFWELVKHVWDKVVIDRKLFQVVKKLKEVKRAYKRVVAIKDMRDCWCNDKNDISRAITDYYKWRLGSENPCDVKDEIRKVMFGIHGIKAPSPDGFNSSFFKIGWDVFGNDVCECDHPVAVTDFRPIACCNVVYKVITNLLCNRLKKVLPDIIAPNQYDLLGKYKRKSSPPGCIFKIDVRKAYDSMNWGFLEDMLAALKFPDHFCKIIMECFRTPIFSLVINGEVKGILHKIGDHKDYHFHPRCRGIKLNHLVFADDLIVMCSNDEKSAELILRGFTTFAAASGLIANEDKSNVYFCNVPKEVKDRIISFSDFKKGYLPFKYLGVQVNAKKLSVDDCQILINKVFDGVMVVCRNFLWDGRDVFFRTSPIAWDIICRPTKQGGLGVHDCHIWNVVAMGKYVWDIANKNDSLWLRWVCHHYIKGRSWKRVGYPGQASWKWKQIWKIKEKIKDEFAGNVWKHNHGGYTVASAYRWMQNDNPEVPWCNMQETCSASAGKGAQFLIISSLLWRIAILSVGRLKIDSRRLFSMLFVLHSFTASGSKEMRLCGRVD